MSLASIMVHVGADAGAQARVEIARRLAARFEARLIGIAGQAPPAAVSGDIVGETDDPRAGGDIVEGDEVEQPDTAAIVSWLTGLENAFRAEAELPAGVTFRRAVEQPTTFIVREARAADLVILGRAAAFDIADRAVDPATVLMHSGRPLLVVPDGVGTLSAKRVVIGWKDTREARRALHDALPLLKRTDEVIIASVEEPYHSPVDPRTLDDVAAYLDWHGVGATITRRPDGNVGEVLGTIAGEKGADLIIAGGYGHSRLSERVFGGVTQQLLWSSPLCCLLSH
jgi:nucleotide-binding universal stress UspA family protein